MKNTLGHDNESEILTVIARLRENKFNIFEWDADHIFFEIKLVYGWSVPVPYTTTHKIKFVIERKEENGKYEYYFMQIKGKPSRKINRVNGYIIWSLLMERYE